MDTQLLKTDDCYRNLCLKYGDTIYGLIIRSVKDPEIAEKLFLKVFLKIQKQIPSSQFTENGLFINIISIVKHAIIQSGNQLLCIPPLKWDAGNNYSVGLIESQEKSIFDLIFLDGYSIDEVSKKSGLSINEIKQCVHQSVKRLMKSTSINLP